MDENRTLPPPEFTQLIKRWVEYLIWREGGQSALARAMNHAISQSQISQVAQGARIGLNTITTLANFIGCSTDDLVYGRIKPPEIPTASKNKLPESENQEQESATTSKRAQWSKLHGGIVQNARKRSQMTQEELAKALGITGQYMSKIERAYPGAVPSEEMKSRLEEILKLPSDWLLGQSTSPDASSPSLPVPPERPDTKPEPEGQEGRGVREVVREYDERYPNRARAWKVLEDRGETFSPSVVFEVNSMQLSSDDDPSVPEWIEVIKTYEKQKKFERKFGRVWHEPVRDEDDEDYVPRKRE